MKFFQKIKKIVFVLVLLLITYNAHYSERRLYWYIGQLGLNIPMTPFTADMSLMLKDKKEAYYEQDFSLKFITENEFGLIRIKDLGWYQFKAPFQALYDCKESGSTCSHIVYYICRSLSDHLGRNINSWAALYDQKPNYQDNIFGVKFKCN
jgi:hypothetical protein